MAKKGMKRPDWTKSPNNDVPPVPEIQGKAKSGNVHTHPVVTGSESPTQKVYHTKPFSSGGITPSPYDAFDSDLANENLLNDLPGADLQDL